MARGGRLSRILLVALLALSASQLAAGKYTVGDDLRDVVDNEEDEHWKSWEGHSRYDDPTQKAATFAMIKLQYKTSRNLEEVRELADRWTDKLQTGAATVGFKPIDPNTLFINLRQDDELENVKQFVLDQPETYEIMINGRTYRRPGDPSVEEAGRKIEAAEQRKERLQRMAQKRQQREMQRAMEKAQEAQRKAEAEAAKAKLSTQSQGQDQAPEGTEAGAEPVAAESAKEEL